MSRFIFTCMLAAVSGAWTICSAVCMASHMPQTGETKWFTGQLQEVAYPCEEGEPCPACLTVALVTKYGQTYYLTDMDEEWQQWVENTYLENWYMYSIALSGRRFTQGSYEYIQIEDIRAKCMGQISTCLDRLPITISGTLVPYQAGEDDHLGVETDCKTVVLENTEGTNFFLNWSDASVSVQLMLDTLQHSVPVILSGQLDCGSIIVLDISIDLPSLCDEWNVRYDPFAAFEGEYYLHNYRLTSNVIIGNTTYRKLVHTDPTRGTLYDGAIREGSNRDIYFIPTGQEQEYLLYNFNAEVGDTLYNLWVGCYDGQYTIECSGQTGVVTAITTPNTSPRIFTIAVETYLEEWDQSITQTFNWIEGVGFPTKPNGDWCPEPCVVDYGTFDLLCAFRNGKKVYAVSNADNYNCCNDSNDQPADTIPLYRYTGDGPDGSTVDPVDPNQVVVILQGDELTIREFMGEDITYNLEMRTQNNAPAQAQAPAKNYASQTFREYVAIQLTEDGSYTLQLTNPEWGYGMVATFNYGHNALPFTSVDAANAPQKILRDGQLLIRQGERMFTPTGMQVE